ncbi:MAG: ATP-dependent DNA helicase Rep [Janthinobacterium sp.]
MNVLGMQSDEQEAEQIAIMISAHRFERKTKWSDYAILYRGNHQARVIEQSMRKERIPYTISGGQSFFDKAEIKDIISYLRLLANEGDDPAFIRAVTTPKRGVGMATLEVLGTFSKQWNCSLFEAASKGGLEALLPDRQLLPLRQFCTFINQLEARASRPGPAGSGDNAAEVLDDMMKEINYESFLYDGFDDRAAQGKWQNVLDFTSWLKERGRGGKDKSGAEKNLLELTQMVALMTMLEGKDEEPDAVRMSTLHASKGLEFPHVFLVGVEEGILPHRGDPDAPAETIGARIEEERRLMYVGITRAQRSLHVTWCKKRKRAGEQTHCDPSRFIKEMQLDVGTAVPLESEIISPKDRLAMMKALLATPKA